jgi:hypothetical protein
VPLWRAASCTHHCGTSAPAPGALQSGLDQPEVTIAHLEKSSASGSTDDLQLKMAPAPLHAKLVASAPGVCCIGRVDTEDEALFTVNFSVLKTVPPP